MKWNFHSFFQRYKDYLPEDEQGLYQWGCDEIKRILIEGCTLADKAGNADLVEGFSNICIEPERRAQG